MKVFNETSNALFNAYDIRKTIESHSLGDIKRVHGGTDNDNTLEDLINDLVYFLERLDESIKEQLNISNASPGQVRSIMFNKMEK